MATSTPGIRGVFPIVPTPFSDDGRPDEPGLARVVEYILAAGADGLVFPGVASEVGSLEPDERRRLTELVLETTAGRRPVIVGASAPTAELAADLARHAAERGAAAIMAMAPAAGGAQPGPVLAFFAAVARAGLPIVLQNAPSGANLAPEAVLEVAGQLAAIGYVKEENLPCGQRITRLLEGAPPTLEGVFGGAGARYVMDELERGATGTMPACELTELHVSLWRAWNAGDRREARTLYNRSLPALTFQAVFRMAMTKEVLRRRGLIGSAFVRERGPRLDPRDGAELSVLLEELRDLLSAEAAPLPAAESA